MSTAGAAYLCVLTWTSGASGVALLPLDVDTVAFVWSFVCFWSQEARRPAWGASYLQVTALGRCTDIQYIYHLSRRYCRCGIFSASYVVSIINRTAIW